jgi:neutral trehalase
MQLLVARDRPEVVPTLLERFNTVADAVNKYMWDPSTNIYTNILYNGSYYRRYSPTSVFPLISGIASDAQVVAMVNSLIANPAGLCLNGSHTGPANNAMLQQWWDADITDNAGCLTDACMGNKVGVDQNKQ